MQISTLSKWVLKSLNAILGQRGGWVHCSVMVMALVNRLTLFLGRRGPKGPSQEEGDREKEGGGKEMRKEREKDGGCCPMHLNFRQKWKGLALPELSVVKSCVTQALLLL